MRNILASVAALLLTGCVATNQAAVVSAADIPVSKYRQIAVFAENVSQQEQRAMEETLVQALASAGAKARSGSAIYGEHGVKLTSAAKGRLIKEQGIDAVLFVKLDRAGESQIANARFDGRSVLLPNDDGEYVPVGMTGYSVKADGSVYQASPMLSTTSQLQDVKSSKLVWASQATTYPQYSVAIMGIPVSGGQAADSLVLQAAKEIAEKMRADGAI
jgi:hypothetical protein